MAGERPVELGISGITDAVVIGRGGFATVYRAFQPTFERLVAVKVFGDLDVDENMKAVFERECRAIGRMAGRANILTVYDAGTTSSGQPYLTMAYMAGGSLADRLRREGPLPWRAAVGIGVMLARALDVAHRAGVLHRDVKPENILLSADGDPQLADFGIARLTDVTRTTKTGASFTPAHVAPETLAGLAPTAAVDIYSLASTLFAAIVGRPAFVESIDDNVFVILRRIEYAAVPDLLRPRQVPEALCRSIETAMAKNPADRPPTAAAFGAELEAAAEDAFSPPAAPRRGPSPAARPPAWPPAGTAAPYAPPTLYSPAAPYAPAAPGATTPAWSAGQIDNGPLGTGTAPRRDKPAKKSGRKRAVLIAAVLVTVIAVVATTVVILLRRHRFQPNPLSVAVDANGDVYVADFTNGRVYRVTPGGVRTTVAGGGQNGTDGGSATAAQLFGPEGIAVASDGSVYFSDEASDEVLRVSPSGVITTVAGDDEEGFSGDGGKAMAAELNGPAGLALASDGTLYIDDAGNRRVRCVSNGIITTIAGNGESGFSGDGGPAIAAELGDPATFSSGLAVGPDGSVYIADPSNNRVRRVTPAGTITTVAGNGQAGFSGDGGNAVSAELNAPVGVAVASNGTLYIADSNNARIRQVSPSGIITTVAGDGFPGFDGDGTATSIELNDPIGLAVGSDGTVYIADEGNGKVRLLNQGNITTMAGY